MLSQVKEKAPHRNHLIKRISESIINSIIRTVIPGCQNTTRILQLWELTALYPVLFTSLLKTAACIKGFPMTKQQLASQTNKVSASIGMPPCPASTPSSVPTPPPLLLTPQMLLHTTHAYLTLEFTWVFLPLKRYFSFSMPSGIF